MRQDDSFQNAAEGARGFGVLSAELFDLISTERAGQREQNDSFLPILQKGVGHQDIQEETHI